MKIKLIYTAMSDYCNRCDDYSNESIVKGISDWEEVTIDEYNELRQIVTNLRHLFYTGTKVSKQIQKFLPDLYLKTSELATLNILVCPDKTKAEELKISLKDFMSEVGKAVKEEEEDKKKKQRKLPMI
jgi:hypothetical protein